MSEESQSEGPSPLGAAQLLFSVLSPGMINEAEKLQNGESELVHYTTAENAINILKSKQFWLRSVSTMNDFMEVEHGISLLQKAFGGPENPRIARLCGALDKICEGAAREGVDLFNEWLPQLTEITFIGCLSQAEKFEEQGRLSMWRAYSSPNAGVAIVMTNTPFIAETNELKAYSLPVAYLTDEQFLEGIDRCLSTVEVSLKLLASLEREEIVATIFWWLLSMSVSLKHPGFFEEREWRIIYFPKIERSSVILESVESVRGIPQIIQKIPLLDDQSLGLHGASPDSLIKKVIVGPTEFPLVVRDALVFQMNEAGVTEPEARVKLSNIPLR